MSNPFNVIAVFFVPLIVGVISFFAYKFLLLSRQMGDMHLWHARTDHDGNFVWYRKGDLEQINNVVKSLNAHMVREEAALVGLQLKIDTALLRQGEIMEKITDRKDR
jgi:hypothetical protein